MAVTYRTTGAWGAGKGSPLTEVEVDNSFYTLAELATALAARPAPAINVQEVVKVGDAFKVVMSDATEYGPFDFPQVKYTWRGDWAAGVAYSALDMINVPDFGVVYVLVDHTSESTFDIAASDSAGSWYQQMCGVQKDYDLSLFIPGVLGDWYVTDSPLYQYVAPREIYLPAGTGTTLGTVTLNTADTTAALSLGLTLNGSVVGSIDFEQSATTGTITIPITVLMSVGDLLAIEQPSYATAAADMAVSFKAKRGRP